MSYKSSIERATHLVEMGYEKVQADSAEYLQGELDAMELTKFFNGRLYKNDMQKWVNYVIGYDDAIREMQD